MQATVLYGVIVTVAVFFGALIGSKLLAQGSDRLSSVDYIGTIVLWSSASYVLFYITGSWIIFQHAYGVALGVLILLVVLGWLAGRGDRPSVQRGAKFPKLPQLLVGLLVALIGAQSALSLLNPAMGWDVLDFWGATAQHVLASWQSDQSGPYNHDHRHPLTISLMLAFPFVTSPPHPQLGEIVGANVGWLLLWIAGAGSVLGFALMSSQSWTCGLMAVLVYLTLPLAENHALLYGYSEMPVGICLITGSALIATSLQQGRHPEANLLFGTILVLCVGFLRNTGGVYAVLVLFAWVAAKVFTTNGVKIFTLLALGAVSSMLLVSAEAPLRVFEQPITIGFLDITYDTSTRELTLGGRPIELSLNHSLSQIGQNLLYSLLLNQSFSLFLPAYAMFSWVVFTNKAVGARCSAEVYIWLAVTFLFTMLLMSQFTWYGFINATPTQDTGGSRFFMPVVLASTLLVPQLYKQCAGSAEAIVTHD